MKSRHTQYLDAVPVSQLLQLAQSGWALFDIAKHDPKARPVALKISEKPFGLCAIRTALADKDLDIRLLTGRLDCRASERQAREVRRSARTKGLCAIMTPPPRRTLARIIRDGSSRNRAVALRDGHAASLPAEGSSQQRIRDCSRSAHE